MKGKRKLLKEAYDKKWQQQFISSIPPHLTPEEQKIWEEELKYSQREKARRIKEGFYEYGDG